MSASKQPNRYKDKTRYTRYRTPESPFDQNPKCTCETMR